MGERSEVILTKEVITGNRAVTFMGPHKMEKVIPSFPIRTGRKIEHAVILKLVATNICGSDLHIYNGRFTAPAGMQMGHENTGEVVEVGPMSSISICSVPFNVACGTCFNCKDGHTDVCLRHQISTLARGGRSAR